MTLDDTMLLFYFTLAVLAYFIVQILKESRRVQNMTVQGSKILGFIALVLLIIGIWLGVSPDSKPQHATALQTVQFDHSQCQYPTRTTNPVDGCDNSDPCDPEMTKGGSGDCVDYRPPKQSEVTPMVTKEVTSCVK